MIGKLALFTVLGLAGLLSAVPPAYGGAYVAECADADPENYEDVYACVSSYRHKRTGHSGFEATFSRSTSACLAYQTIYAAALRESGIANANPSFPEGRARIPSCEMLAKVREDWTGQPPSWQACLDFDPARSAEHLPECVTGYLRGLKGRDKPEFGAREAASFLPTCEEALRTYETALRDAHAGREPPPEYQRLDCSVVAEVLTAMQSPTLAASGQEPAIAAQWGACLGYDGDNASGHIERCMTGYVAGIEDCGALISAYEGRLRAAYGGSFPVGYLRPKCFDAADMIEAAKIAAEEVRAQAAARQREIEAAYADRPEEPSRSWLEAGAALARDTVMVVRNAGRTGVAIIWGGVKELLFGEE